MNIRPAPLAAAAAAAAAAFAFACLTSLGAEEFLASSKIPSVAR